MHPVYVKDEKEQVAPTPLDEVRLRFNGWRLKGTPVKEPPQPTPPDPAQEGISGVSEGSAKAEKPRRRTSSATTE